MRKTQEGMDAPMVSIEVDSGALFLCVAMICGTVCFCIAAACGWRPWEYSDYEKFKDLYKIRDKE